METKNFITSKQQAWAKRNNISFDKNGYITDKNYVDKNIFHIDNQDSNMNESIWQNFNKANGSEFKAIENNLPKAQALHSSSILCLNVFQYFYILNQNKDEDAKKILLGLNAVKNTEFNISNIQFEYNQFNILDNTNFNPNIDLIINTNKRGLFAIESKFLEPYRDKHNNFIQQSYYKEENLWNNLKELKQYIDELPETTDGNGQICKQIFSEFKYLNAAQLVKHYLCLSKNIKEIKKARLIYIYYDACNIDSYQHRQEIEILKKYLTYNNITFTSISYQELIYNLNNLLDYNKHKRYLDYINERYL